MIDIRFYDVILDPVITEKATLLSEKNNQIFFNVALKVGKSEIKAAIENLFHVNVKAVNTCIRKGKKRRYKGILGRQSDTKKAVVTLLEGQSIDFSKGL
ncbi:MAG: large subunit ribosomal protein L23 [Candidatus Tokpelaia sp. JSC161]|jgi:large subunit ribosomal protein L23|nr:MAG: large subunit ribosomal protein L23 [Candidatus Tokpelaia sp. JSC161]